MSFANQLINTKPKVVTMKHFNTDIRSTQITILALKVFGLVNLNWFETFIPFYIEVLVGIIASFYKKGDNNE